MSELHGSLFVGGNEVAGQGASFYGVNPATASNLDTEFHEATVHQVADAVVSAEVAFRVSNRLSASRRAEFLRAITEELLDAVMPWLQRASVETGLPIMRLENERLRTMNQWRRMACETRTPTACGA